MGFFDDLDTAITGARWVTIKGGTRVRIDAEGRVTRGGPAEWEGVHVQDIPVLMRRIRAIDAVDCTDVEGAAAPAMFRTQAEGVRALLLANPDLHDFLEANTASGEDSRYRAWKKSGGKGRRRGDAKPELRQGDGRFDAFNEKWNLRGRQRIMCWLEAVDRTVPASRRWDDFRARLPVWEDAIGLRLVLPGPAFLRKLAEDSEEDCEKKRDELTEEILEAAKAGRLAAEPKEEAEPDESEVTGEVADGKVEGVPF